MLLLVIFFTDEMILYLNILNTAVELAILG
jgi:hypothetical protein